MITKEHIYSICFEQIIPEWNSMPDTFPDFLQTFSQDEKSSNENFLDAVIPKLHQFLQDFPQNPSKEHIEEMKKEIDKVLEKENILRIREHISKELMADIEQNAEQFFEKARAFDETLPMVSIWQAMRNYLIYAIMINLQGKPQNCHNTIVGYSLLYPYTDNYIDELHRRKSDKKSYNALIRKTLLGEDICPHNDYEEKTKQLLKLVLNYYNEDTTRQRSASHLLLLMLEAQEKSMEQIHHFAAKRLTQEKILRISTYKGGLSVLLDYLFSIDFDDNSIKEEECCFYLQFGLILQLADDLQDIMEDKKKHSQTLLTTCTGKKALETTVNRLLQFSHNCITGFSPRNPELHTFMLHNCELMLLTSVAQNYKYFSQSYLNKIEAHLPFSLSYIQKLQKTNKLSSSTALLQFN